MDFKKFLNDATNVGIGIISGAILGTISHKIIGKIIDYKADRDVKWFLGIIENCNKDEDPHDRPCIRTCGCTGACHNDVECECFCLVCDEVRRLRDFYKRCDEAEKKSEQREIEKEERRRVRFARGKEARKWEREIRK